jgi:hypothetical protein
MTTSYLSESSRCDFVVKFRVLDFFNIVAGTPTTALCIIGLFLKWKDFVPVRKPLRRIRIDNGSELASFYFTTPIVQISFRILS